MKSKQMHTFRPVRLGAVAGVFIFGLMGSAFGQQPVLRTTAKPVAFHGLAAREANPGEAEVQGGQNTPAPPPPPVPGQAIHDELFAGTEKFAKGASEATEVNMDPDSLSMVNGKDASKAHRTVLSVVRTYTYDKPGMYNMADVDEFRQRLNSGDWHCSVHTRDLKTGESTDICRKRRGTDMVEDAIITVEPKSLTFIHTIRRVNGQGGHMEMDLDLPSMESFSSFGPNAAVLRAEILASTASLRAEMPAMLRMQQQMHFPQPPQPPAIPRAPKAPRAPRAPHAPEVPHAGGAPAAPAVPQLPAAPSF